MPKNRKDSRTSESELLKDKRADAALLGNVPGDIGQFLSTPAPWGGNIYTGPKAEEAARQHNEYLHAMTSMHRSCSPVANWRARATAPKPPRPLLDHTHENRAQQALDAYQPSFTARLLGKVEYEREALREDIEEAVLQDQQLFDEALQQYERDLEKHKETVNLARGVLAGDPKSFQKAISLTNPLIAIGPLGQRATFAAVTAAAYTLELLLHADDVVPEQRVRLLASGRVAVQPLPRQDNVRLLRDYVCSASLRAVRELLALLPLEEIIVTVIEDTPESSTGAPQRRTLLRFLATPDDIAGLKFHELDSVEAMLQLSHETDFEGVGELITLDLELKKTA